jgi:succinoglycan biosynthesis transport protein ExoP
MEQDLTSLSAHVAVLRRRWRVIGVCVLLGLIAGIVLALTQQQLYTASSKLLLGLETSTSSTTPVGMDPEEVATQAEVVRSDAVARQVIEDVGLDDSVEELLASVTVQTVDNKRVVLISAVRPDAEEAAEVANAFANEYVDLRIRRALNTELVIRQVYQDRLNELRNELGAVRDEIDRAAGTPVEPELRAQRRSLIDRQAELQTAVALRGDLTPAAGVGGQLLEAADPPQQPSQPRLVPSALFGAVIGLLAGLLLSYVRDRTDDVVRDEDRLNDVLGGLPVLGRIPTAPDGGGRVTAVQEPHSPTSEAYRTLSTNIRFLLAAKELEDGPSTSEPTGMVLVTSSQESEGKTSVATNLAVAAARAGITVILVDADLRKPSAMARFGVDAPEGLTEVLAGNRPVESMLVQVGIDNLSVLPAGSIPPNPAELLASPRTRMVWKELREAADLVVIDAAPVLSVADTLELVGSADEIVLVARRGHSRLRAASASKQRIRQVGGRVSGVVITAAPVEPGYSYGRAE